MPTPEYRNVSSLSIALVILACMFAGIFVGILLKGALPGHHTKDDSKETMKTAVGMMATLVALIIGLLVSSAKSNYDATNASITQGGAKIITLDQLLGRYGSQASDVRAELKRSVAGGIERLWPSNGKDKADLGAMELAIGLDQVYDGVRDLAPQNPAQEYIKSQALQISADLLQARWMVIEQSQNSLPPIFLIVLTFWLSMLFLGLGLLTPRNTTTIITLMICSISMAGAVYLIMELNHPLEGGIRVSSAPLQKALSLLGK